MKLVLIAALFLVIAPSNAQDKLSPAEQVIGVWRMDPRTLHSPGVTYYQEDGTVTIKPQADGRYSVISRITTRMVSETEEEFDAPGCDGVKECRRDSATEGIGALFRTTLYIDWFDEGWIDDFFKINGNVMTGDDGNGLIRLVKEE